MEAGWRIRFIAGMHPVRSRQAFSSRAPCHQTKCRRNPQPHLISLELTFRSSDILGLVLCTVMCKLLLISHSGRFCSAGTLLYRCASVLRGFGVKLYVCFSREAPIPEVELAYRDLDASVVSRPFPDVDLILANTQANANVVAQLGEEFRDTPVILWFHEAWPPKEPPVLHRAINRTCALIFQSTFQRDTIYREFLGESNKRIYIIPNAVPFNDGGTVDLANRLPLKIAAVGAIQKRKRQADLIRAVEELELPLECWIVGPIKDDIIDLNRITKSDVYSFHFTGEVTNDVARSIIKDADLIVHPSECESQSLTVLEAMVYAKPLLLADLPVYSSQYLEHGVNCWTYPIGDINLLKENLRKLLSNQPLRRKLGIAAHQTYLQKFGMDQFDRQIAYAIADVLLKFRAIDLKGDLRMSDRGLKAPDVYGKETGFDQGSTLA